MTRGIVITVLLVAAFITTGMTLHRDRELQNQSAPGLIR